MDENLLRVFGWKVINQREGVFYALRELTGKRGVFFPSHYCQGQDTEISNATVQGFHPFIYEEGGIITFQDWLSGEYIKRP